MKTKTVSRSKPFHRLIGTIKVLLNKLAKLFKNNVSSKLLLKPPILRRVQIVEFLSFDEIAFARSYSVVQVRDVLRNELMNVYDIQLRYMNGGVYLLKEGDSLL